jgi:hypothetical protein
VWEVRKYYVNAWLQPEGSNASFALTRRTTASIPSRMWIAQALPSACATIREMGQLTLSRLGLVGRSVFVYAIFLAYHKGPPS